MALENASDVAGFVFDPISVIFYVVQAIGIVIIGWIIFQIISYRLNRKKLKKIESIQEDIQRIEKKIDRLLKK